LGEVFGPIVDEDVLTGALVCVDVHLQLAQLGLDLGDNRRWPDVDAPVPVREAAAGKEAGSDMGDLIGTRVELADVGTARDFLAFPKCQKLHSPRPFPPGRIPAVLPAGNRAQPPC
jgi:hypothetical protein